MKERMKDMKIEANKAIIITEEELREAKKLAVRLEFLVAMEEQAIATENFQLFQTTRQELDVLNKEHQIFWTQIITKYNLDFSRDWKINKTNGELTPVEEDLDFEKIILGGDSLEDIINQIQKFLQPGTKTLRY